MKGNVLRKRNSISPFFGKSWKKGEKERLPTIKLKLIRAGKKER